MTAGADGSGTAEPDARAAILAALAHHGLHPSAAEIDALVAGFPAARSGVARLYTLPGVRYEVPATVFDPRVRDA